MVNENKMTFRDGSDHIINVLLTFPKTFSFDRYPPEEHLSICY